jgi:putative aldouronate transport system substrate-binding protein
MNFGIEDESYTMVNGEPIYTDLIMKNEEDLTPDIAVAKYTATFGGTTLYHSGYYKQMLALPQQQEALKIWGDGDFSMTMPPITPTSEESQRLATIMNEVNTYVDEMLVRYIMGQDDVDNFEDFRSNLKQMNIDEAIQIAQTALDRYNARK